MFNRLLRENRMVSYLLTVLRIYLGYAWMTAGWHKLKDGFDATGFLKNAVANPVASKGEVIYPTWNSFIENFALPNAEIFNTLIPWGEFLVGLGLILGCFTTAAMFFGLVMNFSFMLSGTVSHNPTDILLGFIILSAGYNASKYIGLDRWVIPYLNQKVFHKTKKNNIESTL